MKKVFLFVAFIATISFAACTNSEKKADANDTTEAVENAQEAVDEAAAVVDSAAQVVDSAAQVVEDAAN